MKLETTRRVYMAAQFAYGPLSELAPEITLRDGQGDQIDPQALQLTSGDGVNSEANLYVLDDGGKEALLRLLTGGVIIPAKGAAPARMDVPRGRPR